MQGRSEGNWRQGPTKYFAPPPKIFFLNDIKISSIHHVYNPIILQVYDFYSEMLRHIIRTCTRIHVKPWLDLLIDPV